MTMEEFLAMRRRDETMLARGECPPGVTPCGVCKVPLQTAITGRNMGPEGELCDDCYYAAVGKLVVGEGL